MRNTGPCFALVLAGCSALPPSDPPPPAPLVGQTRQIVPGDGLPDEYREVEGLSNNNLDVVRHEGAVFLATRKAPNHFASPEARLFVFRSTDEETWTFETSFQLGSDLREPRLLSYQGRLFLYFAQLGTNPGTFEPRAMMMSERLGPGQWSEPAPFYRPDEKYIPWRVKVRRGKAWLVVYNNGQRVYDLSGEPIDIELLTSDDGVTWAPVDPARPVVSTGGGSETDFDFDAVGDLWAVIRNEAGDETGWGSKLCHARADDLGRWSCEHDPRKYDSPLVFAQDGQILIIGRRNVTETGHYELNPGEYWSAAETINNLSHYWTAPKRCTLWHLDRTNFEVTPLVDLPGWGDTCFPALLDNDDNVDEGAGGIL